MDIRTARRNFRALAKKLNGKRKTKNDKLNLIDAMTRAFTADSLAKFIVKNGCVPKLAKSRMT